MGISTRRKPQSRHVDTYQRWKMRLELKILAIVFLLIGVYVGVTRLRESQIDNKNVPEGLVLAPVAHDLKSGLVLNGEGADQTNRCPQGKNYPDDEEWKMYWTPSNFLQKHFCSWCRRDNYDHDAVIFSRRRYNHEGFQGVNTVIVGLTSEEARWTEFNHTQVYEDGSIKIDTFCTHEWYTTVLQCSVHYSEDDHCIEVGLCKTFHSVEDPGHLNRYAHCLHPVHQPVKYGMVYDDV